MSSLFFFFSQSLYKKGQELLNIQYDPKHLYNHARQPVLFYWLTVGPISAQVIEYQYKIRIRKTIF